MSENREIPTARRLTERYCPNTGAPLRVGKVWPPRLVVHDVCAKGMRKVNEAIASVYVRHELRRPVEVLVKPGNAPAHDPAGQPIPGLTIGRSARMIDKAGEWALLPITLQWTPELQTRLLGLPWVRKELIIELKDGGVTRSFQWYAYLTPDPPQLPRHASLYDDHPHYRWVTHQGEPLRIEGVSERWIELPAPMSSPALTPACWVQARRLAEGPPGPSTLDILPVFPLEPAVPSGLEVAGWNGALGGHDRRPMLLPLGVRSHEGRGGVWSAELEYWDTPLEGQSGPLQHTEATALEKPTACVWPRVLAADASPVELWQLRKPTEKGRDVKLNIRVRLPDDAEPIQVTRADIRLGGQKIGTWLGGPLDLFAGREWSLPCSVNQDRIAELGQERLKLTIVFHGRPSRGMCAHAQEFRTDNGPYVRVHRARYAAGRSRRPWLVIDLGTEGTCAAVAFLDGFAPRVLTVQFAEGPIHPSRVYVSPGQGGAWTLTDQPTDDALYTTGIKLGLRFGDGAHPGCPDHVSAIEVARFYLKRFLLELRERAAWFPLEDCDVLVSFPPRLACMPRFVGALRETFTDVIPEVLWPDGRHGRIRFREEAFLVAMPSLYKDLQLKPLGPNASRFYWVMDFGGGTTDVCGFLCTADEFGEEHTISHFSYPQRFPHHLSGNDVTAAFYMTLRRYLEHAGVVAGSDRSQPADRQFVFPEDPFPSTRSTQTALMNQTALRELADLIKCTPPEAQGTITVRELAKLLRSTTIRAVDDVATTLVALLATEVAQLGALTARQLHGDVLDPTGARGGGAAGALRSAGARRGGTAETATVNCIQCNEPHVLPVWVFSSNRAFRFRCRSCGKAQQLRGLGDTILPEGSDDDSPTIVAWNDGERSTSQALLLKQDHQNYRVDSWETVRRWVQERRVGANDLVSETGVVWDKLSERAELLDLFHDMDDPTEEIPDEPTAETAPERAAVPFAGEDEGLGVEIERFLLACQDALDRALERLPEEAQGAEIVVLLAGRASQFRPVADGVHTTMSGRVIHLHNDWVKRVYGTTGTIDPTAGLKTLTVNGGGLFALNQTHADTSHLLLSFDTDRIDCNTYLDTGQREPWLLTRHLALAPGCVMDLASDSLEGEPLPPLPEGQALLGELRLQIEGLPQDRHWEPWVTLARGSVRRIGGHRPRVTGETELVVREGLFVLRRLTHDGEVEMVNLLPKLELLGSESENGR
ncbi:MAG: hypothetical protein H6737_13030 [Alphaproteobacteria bacterium]|nr:hypothetical protein [Alphaproteobacteria bacterium]